MASGTALQKTDRTFPRSSRLLKKSQFQTVLDQGQKVVSSELVVFAKATGSARLGLIVSKKLGNAVMRNLVKRRLREAYRTLTIKPGWEIVIIARQRAREVEFEELARSLGASLRRLEKRC